MTYLLTYIVSSKFYNKRCDFNFEIVHFLFLDENVSGLVNFLFLDEDVPRLVNFLFLHEDVPR